MSTRTALEPDSSASRISKHSSRRQRDPSAAGQPLDRPATTCWIDLDESASTLEFARAVRTGLGADPKTLPSQFFYDEEGSRLFEEICSLPEYYLTRAEAEILEDAAPDLARRLPETRALIELGSGSAVKTEVLLRAFESDEREICYAPIDVSRSALEESVTRLEERHPQLEIVAAVAEYESGLAEIQARELGPSLTLWLGSSIGNLKPKAATRFLGRVRDSMGEDDRMLVGIDLRKDRRILEDAYDDSQGVTRRFNLNLLARINRELGGEFDLEAFRHQVHYDEPSGAVQSFLESQCDQRVAIAELDLEIPFRRGERIHTEDSHKYSFAEIDAIAGNAGFELEDRYQDTAGRFTLNLLRPSL